MRPIALSVLFAFVACVPSARAGGEAFLLGGPLLVCGSATPEACSESPTDAADDALAPPRVGLDADALRRAMDPDLWRVAPPGLKASVERLLRHVRDTATEPELDAGVLHRRLAALCEHDGEVAECRDEDTLRSWNQLLDAEQRALLAALESPQLDASGQPRREALRPERSHSAAGLDLLRQFVAMVAGRDGAQPRIAVITAAAQDPYASAAHHEALLRLAGAEPVWWPIDAAFTAALGDGHGCRDLPRLRVERLGLPQRERIHPERTATQAKACEAARAGERLPPGIDAVLLADGEVARLHQAMVDEAGSEAAWLGALREAFHDRRVHVAGIGAGASVLSDAPLALGGGPDWALLRGARAQALPAAGCGRSHRCGDAPSESGLYIAAGGGARLFPGLLLDTGVSEQAHELRLLRLLQIGPSRFGLGIDRDSALHLRRQDGRWDIASYGENGAWLIDGGTPDTRCRIPRLYSLRTQRLEPGEAIRLGDDGAVESTAVADRAREPVPMHLRAPTQPGALRHAARALSAVSDHQTLRGRVQGGGLVADIMLDRVSGETWLRVGAGRGVPPFCPPPAAGR